MAPLGAVGVPGVDVGVTHHELVVDGIVVLCDELHEGALDDPANETFLALITEAFERLLEEPEAREHVAGFAAGDVAFVVTRDGLEVRRRTELYGSQN